MDIIYIRELKVEALIGVYEWEQVVRQTLVLDLDMAVNVSCPAATDDIAHALDYSAVSSRIVAFIEGSQFKLIETLAEHCATIILDEFQCSWMRLSISKPGAIANARDVGVIIERGEKLHG